MDDHIARSHALPLLQQSRHRAADLRQRRMVWEERRCNLTNAQQIELDSELGATLARVWGPCTAENTNSNNNSFFAEDWQRALPSTEQQREASRRLCAVVEQGGSAIALAEGYRNMNLANWLHDVWLTPTLAAEDYCHLGDLLQAWAVDSGGLVHHQLYGGHGNQHCTAWINALGAAALGTGFTTVCPCYDCVTDNYGGQFQRGEPLPQSVELIQVLIASEPPPSELLMEFATWISLPGVNGCHSTVQDTVLLLCDRYPHHIWPLLQGGAVEAVCSACFRLHLVKKLPVVLPALHGWSPRLEDALDQDQVPTGRVDPSPTLDIESDDRWITLMLNKLCKDRQSRKTIRAVLRTRGLSSMIMSSPALLQKFLEELVRRKERAVLETLRGHAYWSTSNGVQLLLHLVQFVQSDRVRGKKERVLQVLQSMVEQTQRTPVHGDEEKSDSDARDVLSGQSPDMFESPERHAQMSDATARSCSCVLIFIGRVCPGM